LIDDRFQQQQSLKNNLSKWVRDSLCEYASYEACQQSLQAFFKRRETQPNPSTSPPLEESFALTAGSGGGGGGGGGDRRGGRGGCGEGGCGGRGLGAGGEEYRQGDSYMTAANACKTLEGPGTGDSVAAGVRGWGGVKVVVGQCQGLGLLTGGAGVTPEADMRLEAGKQREREKREGGREEGGRREGGGREGGREGEREREREGEGGRERQRERQREREREKEREKEGGRGRERERERER
jgi:hypothetical protein